MAFSPRVYRPRKGRPHPGPERPGPPSTQMTSSQTVAGLNVSHSRTYPNRPMRPYLPRPAAKPAGPGEAPPPSAKTSRLITPRGLRSLAAFSFEAPAPAEAELLSDHLPRLLELHRLGPLASQGKTCSCSGRGACPVAAAAGLWPGGPRGQLLALEAAALYGFCPGATAAAAERFLERADQTGWLRGAGLALARFAALGRGLPAFEALLAAAGPNLWPDLVASFPGAPGALPRKGRAPLLAFALQGDSPPHLDLLLARPELSFWFRIPWGGAWVRADEVPAWAAHRPRLRALLSERWEAFASRAEAASRGGRPASELDALLAEAALAALALPPIDRASRQRLVAFTEALLAAGANPGAEVALGLGHSQLDPLGPLGHALDGGPPGPATIAFIRCLSKSPRFAGLAHRAPGRPPRTAAAFAADRGAPDAAALLSAAGL
jgi:hypothetical protein